ncbi:MAG TPA: ABC transporter substrate-binding protein [Ignavibacteria bacterium]|nr:ABC transporter substrate-binding protein [Ignavibacteria bacterium]
MKILNFITLAFLFFSCGVSDKSTENIFRMNLHLGIETLEPVMSNSNQSIFALSNVMEGLVQFDRNNKIIPCLAKDWTVSEDGLIYTFNIKSGIKFHENECFGNLPEKTREVVASDFKYCLERVNNPVTKSRGMWVFRDKILGAKEFNASNSSDTGTKVTEITGISAPNDSTLIITLVSPFAPFLSLLTMSYGYVYPKEAVEYYGEKFGQHPVGTGAFKFVSWDVDKKLIFTKNENYWDKDREGNSLPYLDGIEISFTQSSETEFLDFVNGRYDYHEPSSETYDQLTDDGGSLIDASERNFIMVKQPWLQTVFLGLMQDPNLPGGKEGPFAGNKKLRQAMNYAIDREKIIKFVLKNRGFPAIYGPVPRGLIGYDTNIIGYKYDKEKALTLLSESGYPNGKGLNLTLVTGNDEIQKSIAIAVQEQLKDIGINLKLEQMMQATLLSNQEDGKFAFWRASWGADYFDPENFMALFYSKNITPNGPNRVGYNNPVTDMLYEEALKVTNMDERIRIYSKIQQIVTDDAAWLFLYYNEQIYLLQKYIQGFYVSGLNIINLKTTKKNIVN